MKKINLIYWNSNNFGDELSPLLIEELSGQKVQFKDLGLSRSERLKAVLTLDLEKIKTIIFPHQAIFASIGSIISWVPKGTKVWGSGFMNQCDIFKGGEVYAVRGKLTDEKLRKQGLSGTNAYGDPALLLPLWLNPDVKKEHKLGIIPHWKEVDFFIEKYGQKYHVIDLRTKDIESVIKAICSCAYILSSSLHGIIVAHAYGIPSLWIQKGYIDTDGFKFNDYFSSVDISFYKGCDAENVLQSDEKWQEYFNENQDKSTINNSLGDIQKSLLKSAPFELRKKYSDFLINSR